MGEHFPKDAEYHPIGTFVADKKGEMSQNQIFARSGKGGNLKTKHGLPILDKGRF